MEYIYNTIMSADQGYNKKIREYNEIVILSQNFFNCPNSLYIWFNICSFLNINFITYFLGT